jgi:integrase
MQTTELLTLTEMAYAFEITEYALQALVHSGTVPHTYIQSPVTQDRLLRFDPYTVTAWMQSGPRLDGLAGKNYVDRLKAQYRTRFPHVLTALKAVNAQFSPPRKGKGYSLSKVKSKKHGFLYYVRYIEHGTLVPSRWCTHTSNREAAECFAQDNRESILTTYHTRHDTRDNMYTVLETYYQKQSPYIDDIKKRRRRLCEQVRGQYHRFIQNRFIPFLIGCRVKCFNEITAPVMAKFQTKLLTDNLKPQTINRYMIGIRTIFDHMVRDGYITENILNRVDSLKTTPGDRNVTGCYEVGKPDGIFTKSWKKDERAYLLNLLIYSTGLRNSEIARIKPQNIIKIGTCHFINITERKTENGIRLAPLHELVYDALSHGYISTALQTTPYSLTLNRTTSRKPTSCLGKNLVSTVPNWKRKTSSFTADGTIGKP